MMKCVNCRVLEMRVLSLQTTIKHLQVALLERDARCASMQKNIDAYRETIDHQILTLTPELSVN